MTGAALVRTQLPRRTRNLIVLKDNEETGPGLADLKIDTFL